jgi:hypothetical protein
VAIPRLGAALRAAEAVAASITATQPPKPDAGPERDAATMTGNKPRSGATSQHHRIGAMVTTILKLEEEADTMKQLLIQMSARLLRLELALSVLDKDGSLTAILRPEQFQPEQF